MKHLDLLPSLFKAERQRIISEIRYLFAIDPEIAEDLVSDTFLSATEFWKDHALPQNPAAWLHTVAKNKARNHLKKKAVFDKKLSPELKRTPSSEEIEIDFFQQSINDSQLAMIFTICNPILPNEAQVGLALNLLCGFGIQEIADAFFTTKQVIYKRLERAKDRLKISNVKIRQPTSREINDRLDNVLTILYLMFSEGHFSLSKDTTLRESFCTEAMRLNYLLIENPSTNTPAVNALFALMCFHASRFAARLKEDGTIIPYDDQDDTLWDKELVAKGRDHLNIAATGKTVSKFHLEAGIAYWHTQKEDTQQKWECILRLYNRLLDLEYSPIAALNRTYALAKVKGKTHAIAEAESLQLTGNLFYHSLLSFLYNGLDDAKALSYSLTATSVSNLSRQHAVIA
jgi:RNA polymerase sigma-70 factor (ECF subfamily)